MPHWLIAYVVLGIGATVALARRNFGMEGDRKLLPSFLAWVASIAIVGLVLWTLIACAYLHRQQLSFLPACLLGTAIWASAIVVVYLPGYAAMLAALVRFQKHVSAVAKWVLLAPALAIPAGLALFLGYAWPDYAGDSTHLAAAVAPGIMAWASMYGALIITRRLIPITLDQALERAA